MITTSLFTECSPRVLWLGGSACAGKTTVARRLAARFGLDLYSCDEHFEAHRERADPGRYPAFCRLAEQGHEALWRNSAESRVEELIAFYRDEFAMILEDLAARPLNPVLVEGAGLLPELVLPLCGGPKEALWLVSAPAFRRRAYPRRGPWVAELLRQAASPERAFETWMARDDGFADALVAATGRGGGRILRVDGRSTPRALARRVARYLGLGAAN